MKLQDNFYKIIFLDKKNDGFNAIVELLPDHLVYNGHFPTQPIVPGVFTLVLIRECTSMILGHDLEYANIKECKFISALLPTKGLKVTLDFSLLENKKMCGTVKRDNNTILKKNATLK